jgi:drug/metabolite transporter (DMT)-like permease
MEEFALAYRRQAQYVPEYDSITWLGIGLAIFANALIAISLNIQKYAHVKNEALGDQRLPYHKIPMWWAGMVVNAVGEVGNLVAYGYAEASVITPIGAVGVIFSALIATFILNEKFGRIHGLGIFFIIAGVVLIVYSQGNEKVIEPTVEEAIHQYFLTTQSVCYLIVITVGGAFLYVAAQKHGDQYVILYTSLCSLIAAWTVLGSKAFMAFLRLTADGNDQLGRFPAAFFSWSMLLVIIVAAVASLHFLQMAMRHHANNIVIPTYYATFTLSCIIGAAIVYREFEGMTYDKLMLFFLGLFGAGVGVKVVSTREPEEGAQAREGREDVEMEEGGRRDEDDKVDGKKIRLDRRGVNGERLHLIEMDELAHVNKGPAAEEGDGQGVSMGEGLEKGPSENRVRETQDPQPSPAPDSDIIESRVEPPAPSPAHVGVTNLEGPGPGEDPSQTAAPIGAGGPQVNRRKGPGDDALDLL